MLVEDGTGSLHTVEGMVISLSAEHPLNAVSPIRCTPSLSSTSARLRQPKNVLLFTTEQFIVALLSEAHLLNMLVPKLVTLAGTLTSSIEDSLNAELPKVLRELGSSIVLIAVLAKAYWLMEVMFLDITTSLSEVHPWNALFPIAVTVSGSITLVIAALFWNIFEPMVDTPLGMVTTPDIFAPLNVELPTVAFLIISETTSGEIAPTL